MRLGETLRLTVSARNPANGVRTTQPRPEAVIQPLDAGLRYSTGWLPLGASFDAADHTLTFAPKAAGVYSITFILEDGVIPVKKTIRITVQ